MGLALMVGFYLLAFAMIGALLLLPYLSLSEDGSVPVRGAAVCLLGAAAIFWAILPRIDFFEHPGPYLDPDRHRELLDLIERVARKTGQEMPREIFLVSDMNAWVSSRGGVMGFGSRRVMGLGLPLLQVVSEAELEAILAHEFGHYHGGDTRLGPWIYKTRAAIGRTLENLGGGGFLSLLNMPFRLYGDFFLRVTQAISRAQEFGADRLAAGTVGARALIDGLKKVHAYAPAHSAFWEQELAPVLSSGYRVPMADGFSRFLAAPPVVDAVAKQMDAALASQDADPHDSHPPLAERIAAVEDLLPGSTPQATRPAIELLGDVEAAEQDFIDFFSRGSEGAEFRPLRWEDVPAKVLLPNWRHQAGFAHLGNTPFAGLPYHLTANREAMADRLLGAGGQPLPPEVVVQLVAPIVGATIAAALVREGFELSAGLGAPIVLSRDGIRVEPFALAATLVAGEGQEMWRELVSRTGLEDVQVWESAFVCPSCGASYDPAQYSAEADVWLCSSCKASIPRA